MSLSLREATLADAEILSALGEQTFRETFVEDLSLPYSAADLAEFIPRAYGVVAISRLLQDPTCRHLIAERNGRPVGYGLAGPNSLPHDAADPADGELKRIYFLREAQGLGGGRLMFEAIMGWLETQGRRRVWLGVWSGNLKAQAFYFRNGFKKVGDYRFRVGETLDHEFILRRDAPAP